MLYYNIQYVYDKKRSLMRGVIVTITSNGSFQNIVWYCFISIINLFWNVVYVRMYVCKINRTKFEDLI